MESYQSMKLPMNQYLNIDQTQNFRCLETFPQNSHVKFEIFMFINFITELHNKTKCKQHLQQVWCNWFYSSYTFFEDMKLYLTKKKKLYLNNFHIGKCQIENFFEQEILKIAKKI